MRMSTWHTFTRICMHAHLQKRVHTLSAGHTCTYQCGHVTDTIHYIPHAYIQAQVPVHTHISAVMPPATNTTLHTYINTHTYTHTVPYTDKPVRPWYTITYIHTYNSFYWQPSMTVPSTKFKIQVCMHTYTCIHTYTHSYAQCHLRTSQCGHVCSSSSMHSIRTSGVFARRRKHRVQLMAATVVWLHEHKGARLIVWLTAAHCY